MFRPLNRALVVLFWLAVVSLPLSGCVGKPVKDDPRPVESILTHAEKDEVNGGNATGRCGRGRPEGFGGQF